MVDRTLFIDIRTTGPYYFKHGAFYLAGIVDIDGEKAARFSVNFKPDSRARVNEDFVKSNAGGGSQLKEDIGTIKSGQPVKMAFTKILPVIEKYTEDQDPPGRLHVAGWGNLDFLPALFRQAGVKDFERMFWPELIDIRVLTANLFREYRHLFEGEFNPETIAPLLGIELDPLGAKVDLYRDIFNIVSNNKPEIIAP